jgi:hypothetical protein
MSNDTLLNNAVVSSTSASTSATTRDSVPHRDPDPFHSINNQHLPRASCNLRTAKCWHKPWESPAQPINHGELKTRLPSMEGIIIVEEIGSETIVLLNEACPDLDLLFLHQHVARSEIPQDPGLIGVQESAQGTGASHTSNGLHFDGYGTTPTSDLGPDRSEGSKMAISFMETLSGAHGAYRREAFGKHDARLRRESTRISCCQLRPFGGSSGLCRSQFQIVLFALADAKWTVLLLTDAPLSIPLISIRNTRTTTPVSGRFDRPWRGFNASEALLRTLENFAPREVLKLMISQEPPIVHKEAIFHSLLTVIEWQCIIDDLRGEMRDLQSKATESLEKITLDLMGTFRRKLAASREALAASETQLLLAIGTATMRQVRREVIVDFAPCKSGKQSNVGQKLVHDRSPMYHFHGTTHIEVHDNGRFGTTRPDGEADTDAINTSTLLDKLGQLEIMLGKIAKTINEEIQLFIGSVSSRDSEVMLADSQIMKQQASRTTLLTYLAVIYLPLQLITGIFGMNIKEITGDASLRWWACFIALGACCLLTFLVFLAVRWWRKRRDSQHKERGNEKEKGV